MHLRRLALRNYRRYRDAVVEFPDGVIGFVGRNGAGKSTVVEAITWCLFGHDAARTNRDLIKRSAAAPGDECAVTLEFDVEGQSYRATRRMRGASLQIEVVVESGGNLLVSGGPNSSAEGTDFLRKLLGFDRDAFYASVVARQGELNALSDRTPGARKKLVGRMLGVDAVEAAVARARAARRDAERELGFVRDALAAAKGKKARLTKLDGRLKELSAEGGDAAKRLAETEERIKALSEAHEEQRSVQLQLAQAKERRDAARKEAAAVRDRRAKARNELASLGSAAKELARLEARRKELAPKVARVSTLEKARERFRDADETARRLKTLEADVAQLQEKAGEADRLAEKEKELAAEVRGLKEARRQAAETAERHASKLAVLAERKERLEKDLAAFEQRAERLADLGPDAPCPLCERPLGASFEVLEAKHGEEATRGRADLDEIGAEADATRDALQSVRAERKALDAKEERCASDLEAVRRRRDEARQAKARIEPLAEEANTLRAKVEALDDAGWDAEEYEAAVAAREELVDVEREAARLEERRGRSEALVGELEALADEESTAAKAVEEAEERIVRLTPAAEKAGETKEALEEARSLRDALTRKEASVEAESKALKEEAAGLRAELEELDAKREDARRLESQVRLMEFLASAHGEKGFLQEFKKHLISRIRPALARTASDLLATMTDRRYTAIELDEDYDVFVYDEGEPHPLERFSGGETDVVNLALRLAINELVAQVRGRDRLGFIALDEVFGSQDRERRFHVLSALRGLRGAFRQVLVITHHEEVQERLEHVVHVVADGVNGTRLEVVGQSEQGFEPGAG